MDKFNKMTIAIMAILDNIDESVDFLENDMKDIQDKLEEYLVEALFLFDISKGRFKSNQKYNSIIARIGREMNKILHKEGYRGSIDQYLNELDDVEDANVRLQKTFNELEVELSTLSPAKKFVFDQSEYYLKGTGLQEGFIQPVKYLLMQQVTSGASVMESKKVLHRWTKGELTDGKETMGRQTPNLQRYSTQIARDTAYQYQGVINQIIQEEFDLESFIYVGNLIKDSRPLCVHLVDLDRPIKFDELPPLLKKYPEGQIKGTTKENFIVYRGGYNCRHTVTPVSSNF